MPGDIYASHMARNATEQQRMDDQFHLITDALGWTVHPSISAILPEAPTIADVATGTGLFLRSLSTIYPKARLDGYDISSAMFPSKEDLPSNVTLTLLNAKEAFPDSLHGTYDFIHVRYLIAGMQPEDWSVVLSNLLPALKPGGAIQWVEPAISKTEIVRSRASTKTTAMSTLSNMFKTAPGFQKRMEHGWSTLPDLMREAGLRVETDVVSADRLPESRKRYAENGLVALLATARKLAEAGMPGAMSSERIDELEKMALAEIEDGAYPTYTVHTAVGFKPV